MRISDWSSDVCSSDLPIYLRHSWSLSVEEQFYLLWPLVLPLVLRGRRALIWLMIAYIAVLARRFSFIGDWRSYYYRRSEEHTSELQSLMRISYAVFCLKTKNNKSYIL